MTQTQTALELPTLSARSVALSVLLGVPHGRMSVRDLLATGEMCDIAPATMRVALSRLVAAGELTVADGEYALSAAHLSRQNAQHRSLEPSTRSWDGTWETAIVVETGRDPADRARLRAQVAAAHLAELREGVWMRPANLLRPTIVDPHLTTLISRPSDPELIVRQLWDLAGWADKGHAILRAVNTDELDGRRFAAATALVRHLRTDPVLPPALQPADWPADALRQSYDRYRTQLHAFHVHT
jgi:phenylacetic acid degradation operon negative regulatory protein